jgi:hypothetical protein
MSHAISCHVSRTHQVGWPNRMNGRLIKRCQDCDLTQPAHSEYDRSNQQAVCHFYGTRLQSHAGFAAHHRQPVAGLCRGTRLRSLGLRRDLESYTAQVPNLGSIHINVAVMICKGNRTPHPLGPACVRSKNHASGNLRCPRVSTSTAVMQYQPNTNGDTYCGDERSDRALRASASHADIGTGVGKDARAPHTNTRIDV